MQRREIERGQSLMSLSELLDPAMPEVRPTPGLCSYTSQYIPFPYLFILLIQVLLIFCY